MPILHKTDEEFLSALKSLCENLPKLAPESQMIQIMADPVACHVDTQTALFSFTAKPWMANPMGCVHGGAISTLFDNCMGFLCLSSVPPQTQVVTVNLQVNYLSIVPVDHPLQVHCQIDRMGRRIAYLSARLTKKDSPNSIATATAVFSIG